MSNQEFIEKILRTSEIATKQIERLNFKIMEDQSLSEEIRSDLIRVTKTGAALNESVKYLIVQLKHSANIGNYNYNVALALKEVVDFYANEENWKSSGRKKSAAAIDGGEKARLLLKPNDTNSSDQ